MSTDARPVVVAYDGSPAARSAIREAVALFAQRRLIAASVWEQGLAIAMAPASDPTGIGYASPNPSELLAIDEIQRTHATEVAEQGARLAADLGAEADACPLPEDGDVADTVVALADSVDACAVVAGTRGHSGVRAKLLGSTSSALLHRSRCPVLVVKART